MTTNRSRAKPSGGGGSAPAPTSRPFSAGPFYVNPNGSDANAGTSASAPWATLQRAVDFISRDIDPRGFSVDIYLADGIYRGCAEWIVNSMAAYIHFIGNIGNRDNVVVDTSGLGVSCFDFRCAGKFLISGMRLKGGLDCLHGGSGAFVGYDHITFDTCPAYHVDVDTAAHMQCSAEYSIVGGAGGHFAISEGGFLQLLQGGHCSIYGNPNFSESFIVFHGGMMEDLGCIFSGSATGYSCDLNGTSFLYTPFRTAEYPGSLGRKIVDYAVYRDANGSNAE